MWDERQRTQKIGIELERVKRALREQDEELRDLMETHGVGDAEVVEARRVLDEAWTEEGRGGACGAPESGAETFDAGAFAGVLVRG